MKWGSELRLVEKTIRQAGTMLQQIAEGPLKVLSAEGKDIKLQADQDSEAFIIDALTRGAAYPVLGEESGEHGEDFTGPFWVIDPLDGTFNYCRGIPGCCVSIALMDGERPALGAIYDFNRNELFTAVVGEGAWLNGQPMHVSNVTERAQAVISTGMPTNRDYSDAALLPLIRMLQQYKKVRMIGAAAISLSWTACGRIDVYVEDDVMLWDIAAGWALVEAAGGWIEVRPSKRTDKKWLRVVRCGAARQLWGDE